MREGDPRKKKARAIPNEKLKQERLRRRLTHAQLAELLNIGDPRTISRWERGKTMPSPLSRQKLSEVFGKSEEELGLLKTHIGEQNDLLTESVFQQQEHSIAQTQLPASTDVETQKESVDISISSIKSDARHKNRQRLIARVQAFWITGLLEQSLHGAALIILGLKTQADAIANPWRLVLQLPNQFVRPLPPGTRITQVYDDAANELLILGEPGSGKTTLLLDLARDLLTRAKQDDTHPIPVIFNLSSWVAKRSSFVDWLVEELNSKYQVPRKLGQDWIDTDQMLLLLDGLDEVSETHRQACIQSINAFHQEHPLVPLVVCSRSEEYFVQPIRVTLNAAVLVEPLSTEQIEIYLTSAGSQLEGLHEMLHHDPTLQELAVTPLMLSILSLTYAGKSVEEIRTEASSASRVQVFEHYTQRMLQRHSAASRYTNQQTIHWLAWLARQMKLHNQTVFYLERMQPDWLPTEQMQRRYQMQVKGILSSLFGILIGALVGSLIAGLLIARNIGHIATEVTGILGTGAPFGMMGGLFVGLIAMLLNKRPLEIHPSEILSWSWSSIWQDLLEAVAVGLVGGLTFWHIGEPFARLVHPPVDFLAFWLTYQLCGILIGGIIGLLIFSVNSRLRHSMSQREGWRFIRNGLLIGLMVSFMEAVLDGKVGNEKGSFYLLLYGFLNEPLSRLASGLLGGLLGGFIFGVVNGFSSEQLDKQRLVRPNQGIWYSARNAVLVGLLIWFISWLMFTIFSVLAFKLIFGLIYGLFLGLIFGLLNGGIACLEHLFLRLCLRLAGAIPRNYPRFLDHAAEMVILRKIGGGYIFIHRLLLEYFASL